MYRNGRPMLIFSDECKKCRRVKAVVSSLDFGKAVEYLPWKTKRAKRILSQFYDEIPYEYFFVEDDYCYEGFLLVLYHLLKSIIGGWYPCLKRRIKIA